MNDQPSTINHFKRFYSHVNTANTVLQAYKGEAPFAHYIRSFFSQHKKFGSKDRKQITELCYCFFRLGKSYPQLSIEQKILKGYQLSKKEWPEEWLSFFEQYQLPEQTPKNIFSFKDHLSESIDTAVFEQSHLLQPDLFLRIRPRQHKVVTEKLQSAGIDFSITGSTVRLPNGSKIDDVIILNKEAVVQDYSSQRVGDFLHAYKSEISNPMSDIRHGISDIKVWDCCAASGGKSILAKDVLDDILLTVSDIRPSILVNLKKRFAEAGIKNYHSFVSDSTIADPDQKFDLIIADVPCSGSGTWARTPEQLLFFHENRIAEYAKLQQNIISNVIKYLKPGGYLLYITCSVFAEENEEQTSNLTKQGLKLIVQSVLKGYDQQADTMFAALIRAGNKEHAL